MDELTRVLDEIHAREAADELREDGYAEGWEAAAYDVDKIISGPGKMSEKLSKIVELFDL